jgi:hypothetical protein
MPLSNYTLRTFTTKPWTNATVSFYGATVSTEPWVQLDDVELRRTPGAVHDRHGLHRARPEHVRWPGRQLGADDARGLGFRASRGHGFDARVDACPAGVATATPTPATIGELVPAAKPRFPAPGLAGAARGHVELQVSADGDTWFTVASFDPSGDWVFVELESIGGLQVRVRPKL